MLPVTLHGWEGSQCLSFLEVFVSVVTLLVSGKHLLHMLMTREPFVLLQTYCWLNNPTLFWISYHTSSQGYPGFQCAPGRPWRCCLLLDCSAKHHGSGQFCTQFILLLLTESRTQGCGFCTLLSKAACAWLTLDGGGEGMRLLPQLHMPLPCCSMVTWGFSSSPFCHLLHTGFSHVNY